MMANLKVRLAWLCVGLAVACAAPTSTLVADFEHSAALTSGYNVHWNCDRNAGAIEILVTTTSTGYVGFGIAGVPGKMIGSDIVLLAASNGGISLTDRMANGRYTPDVDQMNNLQDVNIAVSNGITSFAYRRSLDTGDRNDNIINLDGITPIVWALGESMDTTVRHSDRGWTNIEFCEMAETTPALTTTVATTTTTSTTTTTGSGTTTTQRQRNFPVIDNAPIVLEKAGDGSLIIPNDLTMPRRSGLTAQYYRSPKESTNNVLGTRCNAGCLIGETSSLAYDATRLDEPNVDYPPMINQTLGGPHREKFLGRWRGEIFIDTPGKYRFCLDGSEGMRIRVQGSFYDAYWDWSGARRQLCGGFKEFTEEDHGVPGWISLDIRHYFNVYGDGSVPSLTALWDGPGFTREVIPPAALSREDSYLTGSSACCSRNLNQVIDGDESTRWITNWVEFPYLRVDLGAVYNISQIKIYAEGGAHEYDNVEIFVGSELVREGSGNLKCVDGGPMPLTRGAWNSVSCQRVGRFVTITNAKGLGIYKRLSVSELRIWGDLVSNDHPTTYTAPAFATAPWNTEGGPSLQRKDFYAPEDKGYYLLSPTDVYGVAEGPTNATKQYNVPRRALFHQPHDDNVKYLASKENTPDFIVGFNEPKNISMVRIRNTMNTIYQNVGTRNFKLEVGQPGVLREFAQSSKVNQSLGDADSANFVVDGNETSCSRIVKDPLYNRAWLRIDLGKTREIKEIIITGADENMDGVLIQHGTELGDKDGLDHAYCGEFYWSYRKRNTLNNQFSVGCNSMSRYITFSASNAETVCEIKVMGFQGGSWTQIDRGTLDPAFGWNTHRNHMPYVDRVFDPPILAKYIRFTATSFYKQQAGLNQFQVWSKTPPTKYLIMSSIPEDSRDIPFQNGLRASYIYAHGTRSADTLSFQRGEISLQDFNTRTPVREAIVPNIYFHDTTSTWIIKQSGSVLFSETERSIPLSFNTPFPKDVTFTTAIHPSTKCCENLFNVTIGNLTREDAVLSVNALEEVWDELAAHQDGSRILAVSWNATSSGIWPRDNFYIRLYGQLWIPQNGTYTFYLTANDYARMYFNEEFVVDTEVVDGETNHNIPEAKPVSLWLEKGMVDIEIIGLELNWDTALILEWKGPSFGRSIVQPSAFKHRVHKACLEATHGYTDLRVRECQPRNALQHFQVDSDRILAYRDLSIPPAYLCLTNDNRGTLKMEPCGDAMSTMSNELTYYPERKWSFDGLLLRSHNYRSLIGDGGPQFCRTQGYTNEQRYQCETEFPTEPHSPAMCLQHSEFEDIAGTVSMIPCEEGKSHPSAHWQLEPADEPAGVEVVFDGAFTKLHDFWRGGTSKTNIPLATACHVGSEGNECVYACDGYCDDISQDGAGSCASGADSYDCTAESNDLVCARACWNDDDCSGFYVHTYFTGHSSRDCFFFSQGVTESGVNYYYHGTGQDLYIKNSDVETVPHALLDDQDRIECSAVRFENECAVMNHCDWLPVSSDGEPLVDAEETAVCEDTNGFPDDGLPFACKTYAFHNECDQDYVRRQCQMTCDATEYCNTMRFGCVDVKSIPTTPPIVQTAPLDCPSSDGVMSVNGRCRCDTGYSCQGSQCDIRTIQKLLQVHLFEPSCTDCSCIADPTTTSTTTIPPSTKLQATSTTAATATTTTTTTAIETSVGPGDINNSQGDEAKDAPGTSSSGESTGLYVIVAVGVLIIAVVAFVGYTRSRRSSEQVKTYGDAAAAASVKPGSKDRTPTFGFDNAAFNPYSDVAEDGTEMSFFENKTIEQCVAGDRNSHA